MAKSVKALVVSDSHGDMTSIQNALEKAGEIDYFFHLGDHASDCYSIGQHSRAKIRCVRGNCDYISNEPEFLEIVICKQKIILTHGHQLNVKYGTERLFFYAKKNEAKAILYGHTHLSYTKFIDGIWLINPGSIGEPRGGDKTMAILLINDFGIVPKILKAD